MTLVAAGALLAGEARAACADNFKFEPDARLSAQAYLSAMDWMSSPQVAGGATLYFLPFDREDRPQRGGWAVVGAVVADAGMGTIPVGGVLWGRSSLDLYSGGDREQFRKGREGVTLSLSLPALVAACKGSYIFRLDNDNQLFANGVLIGRVKPG